MLDYLDRTKPSSMFAYAKQRREIRNKDKSLWQCPICKNRFRAPRTHLYTIHLMNKKEYEQEYGPFPEC